METTTSGPAGAARGPLVDDEISRKLMPGIRKLAERLAGAKLANRFILLRFHHDADGIGGALALSEVLRFQAFQQNSAVYSVKDAVKDLATLSHEEKPLVLLLDFGMNRESEEGLRLLKAAGVELMVVDHHPPSGDAMAMADYALTPWEVSSASSTSRYVAGYLAAEIARAMGADSERYARVACAGDRSTLLEAGAQDRKTALVLDYLAAHSGFGNNLKFYRNVLSKEELFTSIASQAQESIDEAADRALAGAKNTKEGGVRLCIFNLGSVVRKGEWPPSGKVTTRIFDKLKEGGALLAIGYTDRSIIMRLNDGAVEAGLSATLLAESVKASMADFVDGGGGHAKAGAIRARQGFVKEVLNAIVREAGAAAKKRSEA
jgi:RecJ-like exonuclease